MAFKSKDIEETPIPEIVAEIWQRAMSSTNYKEWESIREMIQDLIFNVKRYSPGSPFLPNLKILEMVSHQHVRDLAPKIRAVA